MNGYNKIKDAMIAVLSASIYYNACITSVSNMVAIVIGTISMFGCSYCLMREADKWNAKRSNARRSDERGKEECTN